MAAALDFHFFIGSTYTYLTVQRIAALAAASGCAVRWRPFSVRSIMLEQNNIPFRDKPVKAAYMRRDIERRAARHGIPFASFPPYPVDPEELATRTAFVGAGEGWCPAFTRAVYEAWFLRGEAPGAREATAALLDGLGLDGEAVLARADSAQARQAYADETRQARDRGIFGSPTFVAGDELFWGDDRLEDAIAWAMREAA
jgi:2-hydroxychromene-2-carboxylate isomerase